MEKLWSNLVLPIKLFLNLIVRVGDKEYVWRNIAIFNSYWLHLFIAIRRSTNAYVSKIL